MTKTIAIVEDEPDQRANYADAITKKGYAVRAFGSRQEALDGFDEALPDLVILDIILGEEVDAGFQLCRDLLTRAPSLPVILYAIIAGVDVDKLFAAALLPGVLLVAFIAALAGWLLDAEPQGALLALWLVLLLPTLAGLGLSVRLLTK